jgi:hypothetical protein
LTPTPHVLFSRLVRKVGTGSGVGAWGGGFVSGGGAPLERVWLSVESGPIELEVLEGLVLALGRTVSHHRDALVPLVTLPSQLESDELSPARNSLRTRSPAAGATGVPPVSSSVHTLGSTSVSHV